MKFLLTICLLLISIPSASAQESKKPPASLTRAQTREAERRLSDMGYWTGAVDGLFDPATRSALIAFQKWDGHSITGQLTIAELEAIRTSASPKGRLQNSHGPNKLLKMITSLWNWQVRILPVVLGLLIFGILHLARRLTQFFLSQF